MLGTCGHSLLRAGFAMYPLLRLQHALRTMTAGRGRVALLLWPVHSAGIKAALRLVVWTAVLPWCRVAKGSSIPAGMDECTAPTRTFSRITCWRQLARGQARACRLVSRSMWLGSNRRSISPDSKHRSAAPYENNIPARLLCGAQLADLQRVCARAGVDLSAAMRNCGEVELRYHEPMSQAPRDQDVRLSSCVDARVRRATQLPAGRKTCRRLLPRSSRTCRSKDAGDTIAGTQTVCLYVGVPAGRA